MTDAADIIAESLAQAGAEVAFGVPGGGPNLDVVGALTNTGIRFVLAHAETAACIMASAYGLVSGKPTTAVVTRGPGAASAVNGAAQATLDRHPLVLVTDTVPSLSAQRVPHQRIDQRAMLGPVTKATATLGASSDPAYIDELIVQATSAPAGAVHLDFDATAPAHLTAPSPAVSPAVPPAAAVSAEMITLVSEASRPIVIVGLGAAAAYSDQLRSTIESFGAPVLMTYQGIGVISTEHHCAAGLFTNGASERELLAQADIIIAVGLDAVEPIPAAWDYAARVISLAEVETTDPYIAEMTEIVGDLTELVVALMGDGSGAFAWDLNAGRDHREKTRQALREPGLQRPDGHMFGPVELVNALIAAVPGSVTATVDAGAHFLAIMPFWPTDGRARLLISNGLATMGYALPAAIGAAFARPGEPVVCMVGDGGLGMTLAELETLARLQLPITVVVFNDSALSLIEIKQRDGHGGPAAVSYESTDFAAIATAVGLKSSIAYSAADITAALDDSWNAPRLIDARIDPTDYRHLIRITRG